MVATNDIYLKPEESYKYTPSERRRPASFSNELLILWSVLFTSFADLHVDSQTLF